MRWTQEQLNFLVEFYPKKGRAYCMEKLGLSEGQVRGKASLMQLKARGVSEAWHKNNKEHSKRMTGRKRPDHSSFMKEYRKENHPVLSEDERKRRSEWLKKYISEKGHPKGATGIKHTIEAKRKMSEASKKMWQNMSEEKRDEYSMRASINARKFASMNRNNASWKAAWREIGDKRNYYRSRWEANYARYLQWLKDKNEIKDWKHEPKTFWFEGIKRGCVSYLPDFCVTEINGEESYHEVKGWMDDRSKTKIKRMAKYFPEVKLVVIDSPAYKNLEKKISPLIDGWEK